MKKGIIFLLCAFLPLFAHADIVEGINIGGIYYNIVTKANVAEVTRNPNKYSGNVVIPETVSYRGIECYVKTILESAFQNCTNLTSVSIPNSVTSIGNSAFDGCCNLKSLYIGNGVVEISDNAFAYCQELTDVYCYAYNVPTKYHSDVFPHSYTKYATLHVPSSSISKYQNATSWKDFGSIVALDNNTDEASSYIRESLIVVPETDVDESAVYAIAEQMPSFKGNVNQWLSQNLTYPAEAAENGVQGNVIVRFVVDEHGNLSNVQVARSIHPSLDREAVSTVRRMPKWNPGMQNGQPVKVWYTLPVSFKLQY